MNYAIRMACGLSMNTNTENSRWVQVVVLGVDAHDEYALFEAMDGSQEQFVVRHATAGQAWHGLRPGGVAWVHVTNGLLGRVLEVRHFLEH